MIFRFLESRTGRNFQRPSKAGVMSFPLFSLFSPPCELAQSLAQSSTSLAIFRCNLLVLRTLEIFETCPIGSSVNPLALPSVVRIHSCPVPFSVRQKGATGVIYPLFTTLAKLSGDATKCHLMPPVLGRDWHTTSKGSSMPHEK